MVADTMYEVLLDCEISESLLLKDVRIFYCSFIKFSANLVNNWSASDVQIYLLTIRQ